METLERPTLDLIREKIKKYNETHKSLKSEKTEETKSEKPKYEELKSEELKSEELKSEELKSEELKSEETKSEEKIDKEYEFYELIKMCEGIVATLRMESTESHDSTESHENRIIRRFEVVIDKMKGVCDKEDLMEEMGELWNSIEGMMRDEDDTGSVEVSSVDNRIFIKMNDKSVLDMSSYDEGETWRMSRVRGGKTIRCGNTKEDIYIKSRVNVDGVYMIHLIINPLRYMGDVISRCVPFYVIKTGKNRYSEVNLEEIKAMRNMDNIIEYLERK